MKYKKYHLLLMGCIAYSQMALGQSSLLNMQQVDSLLAERNLSLKAERMEIEVAEGQYKQSKLWENPEIQVMHNIQNPTNRRWLDTGHNGETDVQLSQPISIGGQHTSRVRVAAEGLQAARSAYESRLIDIRYEAHEVLIDLYRMQQKLKVYDKEIASVEKILLAFKTQTDQGNVSKMQNIRIANMLSQLKAEKAELELSEHEKQSQLRLLLNMNHEKQIVAVMDEAVMIKSVIENTWVLQSAIVQSDTSFITQMLAYHPALQQSMHLQQQASYLLKREKADALPKITLNGEWDKNGNIGHNFFAFGATVAVSLWNRNQGNIRSAKAAIAKKQIEREQKAKEMQTELLNACTKALKQIKLLEEQQPLLQDMEILIEAAEEQFLKRHLSTIEFVDMYVSYREARLQLEDTKAELMKCGEVIQKLTVNRI